MPAQRDVLARMAEVVPPAVEGQRTQDHVRTLTREVGHAHLRPIEAAQNRIQDVARRKIVQVMIEGRPEPIHLPPPLAGSLPLYFHPPSQVGWCRDGINGDDAL